MAHSGDDIYLAEMSRLGRLLSFTFGYVMDTSRNLFSVKNSTKLQVFTTQLVAFGNKEQQGVTRSNKE